MNSIDVLCRRIYDLLDDKKGRDISVLSVRGISSLADYFIIVSGGSSTQIQALADHVEKMLHQEGVDLKHREGKAQGGWILLDYRDIVIHIFSEDMRSYYGLERIWNDAKTVDFSRVHAAK
ncbi:MAG: ribosome-associated protein [Clostridiales bacterium]|jgi:ribosome-associated protein|nr:ribosome-associated protein [Clostridiales bacterium]